MTLSIQDIHALVKANTEVAHEDGFVNIEEMSKRKDPEWWAEQARQAQAALARFDS